jgi:hypothetical protein
MAPYSEQVFDEGKGVSYAPSLLLEVTPDDGRCLRRVDRKSCQCMAINVKECNVQLVYSNKNRYIWEPCTLLLVVRSRLP